MDITGRIRFHLPTWVGLLLQFVRWCTNSHMHSICVRVNTDSREILPEVCAHNRLMHYISTEQGRAELKNKSAFSTAFTISTQCTHITKEKNILPVSWQMKQYISSFSRGGGRNIGYILYTILPLCCHYPQLLLLLPSYSGVKPCS